MENFKKLLLKSPAELFGLVCSIIYTKIFYKNAKLIRLPIFKTNIGQLEYGNNLSIGPGAIIDILNKDAKLKIGNNLSVYHRIHIGIAKSVIIGDNVLIASNVYISDHSHGGYDFQNTNDIVTPPNARPIVAKSVLISDNVWIGEGAMILPGVTIGENSIVGAGSIVTKNIPAYCIAAGNPAKVIKKFNFITKLWEL